jgi:predicted homoserine dehydrogenase-like protein
MNLYAKLQERKEHPLRLGLIGAGKFAAMYLAQVPKTPGIHLVGIADLSPDNAKANLERVGWKPAVFSAPTLDAALKYHTTHLSDDWQALVSHPGIDIIIEATGNPMAAVEHALAAFEQGKDVVMVTVEADAFCGPLQRWGRLAEGADFRIAKAAGNQRQAIEKLSVFGVLDASGESGEGFVI